jgi:hypothetical protein
MQRFLTEAGTGPDLRDRAMLEYKGYVGRVAFDTWTEQVGIAIHFAHPVSASGGGFHPGL